MYVTIYTAQRKGRTVGLAYKTKSLTPVHARIRAWKTDAQTWHNPTRVITDLVPGFNLGVLPVVQGGERIA